MRPKFDSRPTIRVTTTMPDHPKIAVLSDAAFRALVTLWCWCGEHRTDGHVPAAIVKAKVKPRARDELLDVGLLRAFSDGYGMHDYLDHQRSSEEIEAYRQSAAEHGAKGAHLRWHVTQRKRVADCPYCYPNEEA